jgi:hypothetical protein
VKNNPQPAPDSRVDLSRSATRHLAQIAQTFARHIRLRLLFVEKQRDQDARPAPDHVHASLLGEMKTDNRRIRLVLVPGSIGTRCTVSDQRREFEAWNITHASK